MAAALSIAPLSRIPATPYARRLARQRGLSLSEVTGSGPNGRIIGADLERARGAGALPAVTAREAPAAGTDAIVNPSALATSVGFHAAEALLGQIGAIRSGILREDICLKAAALALDLTLPGLEDADILLMTRPARRQVLAGVGKASLSSIAELRSNSVDGGAGGRLAVSFLGHAGVRTVATQLVPGIGMRLVIGLGDIADCLLIYAPSQIEDDAAEGFLVAFREFIETPFRLLV